MKFNMAFLKLLLSSSLIYIAIMTTAISNDKTTENVLRNAVINKLSEYILPLHYNMKLELLEEYFLGEYVITIYIIHATQEISFHMLHPIIIIKYKYIRLELKQNDNRTNYETMSPCYTSNTDHIVQSCIKYNFENVLLPGMYNLTINIKIPIHIVRKCFGTFYINDDRNKEWLITLIGTQTKNYKIFPFWNKPELRITFDISIKHHRTYKALTNMPIRDSKLVDSDMEWTYFNKIDSISIDNIAFVKSDFHGTILTETVSMWCRPNMIQHLIFALYVAKDITMYLKNYWNISERFFVSPKSKVYHIVIPNLQDKVKQTLGFLFYREADIMYSDELDTIGRKMIIAPLVAHGIIQKYIDNLLNPSYWFQLWLNEGFIIFFQAYIVDKVISKARIHS